MAKRTTEEPRLVRVTKIALGLPEAVREVHGSHASFRVRKKVFAYFLNDHHGDGIVSLACKVMAGDNVRLASASGERFYLPAYIGARGWVALRLDVGKIDWGEVKELMVGSYLMCAPKRLGRRVKGSQMKL
jgi:phosphoribosylglycinamide formyltransferase-1